MRHHASANGFLDIPVSRPGRASAIAGGAVFVLGTLLGIAASTGLDGESTVGELVYGLLTWLLLFACIVAVGTGVLAVIRDHVSSFVTVISMLLGGLLGWLLFLEIFVGHE